MPTLVRATLSSLLSEHNCLEWSALRTLRLTPVT